MNASQRRILFAWLAFFGCLGVLFISANYVMAADPAAPAPAAADPVAPDLGVLRVPFIRGTGVTFLEALGRIVLLILRIAGWLAFAYVLYGGILYMTAGGDAGQVGKARQTIINAVIGIFIVTVSYVLVQYVIGEADKLDEPIPSEDSGIVVIDPQPEDPDSAGGSKPLTVAKTPSPVVAQKSPKPGAFQVSPKVVAQATPSAAASPKSVTSPGQQKTPDVTRVNPLATPTTQAIKPTPDQQKTPDVPKLTPAPEATQLAPAPIPERQRPAPNPQYAGFAFYSYAGPEQRAENAGARRPLQFAGSPNPVVVQSPAPEVRRQLPGWFVNAWNGLPTNYGS